MLKQAALDSGCVGFEPQQWRQERCKRCFRLQSQHDQQLLLNDDRQLDDEADRKLLTTATAAADRSKIYRRHSWRSTPATLGQISTTTITKSPTDAAVVPDVSESTTKSSQRYGSASSLNTECLKGRERARQVMIKIKEPFFANAFQQKMTIKASLFIFVKRVSLFPLAWFGLKKYVAGLVGWWWWWWWLIVTWDNVELEWREKRDRRMPHRRTMGKRFPRPFTLCCPARKSGKANSESCQSPYVPSLDVDPMSRTVSYESVASTLCDVSSMVTAQSRASVNSERSSTPTESLDETRLYLRSMRSQLEIVENKCARLEEENANLRKNVRECSAAAAAAAAGATTTTTTTTTSTVVVGEGDATRALQERLALLEGLYEDYRDENLALKSELRDAHESTAKQANAEAKLLKEKLLSMEAICEELMGENDKLKQEMLNLQQEIDEMHDQYREEEIDEFRELQRELEQTAKNCRILQFKLRKAERRNDQSEADRHRLEQQLHEILSQQQQQSGVGVSALRSDAASPLFDLSRRRDLEAELRIAKEVSVRLHNELEMLEEKRCKYEDENFYLKERIREMEAREKIIEQTHLRHHEQRRVFGSAGKLNNDPTAVAAAATGDNNGSATVSSTDNGENGRLISGMAATADGINFGQLLRDFQDSLERETDLKEQLKFAEDDLLSVRQKVADLETENEVMMRQLAKLSCEDKRNSSGSGGSSGGSRPPMTRSYSEGHTQIELELAEHEAEVLKTRLRRTERDNDKLIARVALLEKELQKLGAGNREFSEEELFASVPDTYYKQKAKLLEEELEELRSRFENCNAESDQIYTAEKRKQELPHHQHAVEGDGSSSLAVGKNNNNSPLPSGHSTGTSSTSVDVNRQMRLIEEELEVLRDRNNMLEKENDRLSSEIRKLYLISSTAATRANSNTINNAPQMTTTSVVDKAADCGANLKMAERFSQMEKDIHRFIGRISELEQEKELLVKDLERRKRLDNIKKEESQLMNEHLRTVHVGTASVGELRERVTELLKENVVLTYELQVERRKNREMESLLDDYKEMISTPPAKSGRIACKKTTEDKASETVRPRLEQLSNYARFIADFDAEMGLLCVEFDQLKERKLSMPLRSSSQTSSYAESVDQEKHLDPEVKILKQRLKTLKSRLEEECKLISSSKPAELFEQSHNSQEHEISKLRDQLYLMNAEKCSVQKKFEAGTVRLLQTEERLKKELERLKENYENQVNDLKRHLQDSERLGQENACTVKELEMMLGEKCSHAQELESKLKQIESDTRQRCRELQEKAESDRRRVKEFEIKYQTLESLHDTDQSRWSLEREKLNNDLCELKKRYEEIQADLESCKESVDRKQSTWNRQKADYENRLKQLQAELSDIDRRTAKRAADLASAESQKLVAQLEQMKRQADLEKEALLADKVDLEHKLSQVNKEMINQGEHLERLKEELALMKSRVGEQKQQLQDTRKQRDDFREQLGRLQQSWTRERGELVHKLRQEEKIQQAEQQALRLKYESRIKVMEDSVKRNQSQLSVARHERENFKQNTVSLEKKIVDLVAKHQEEIHALKSQLDILRKQNDEVESIKLQLSQKSVELEQLLGTAKTERDLWLIERKHLESKIKQSSTKSTLKNCSEINFEKEKMLTDAIEIAGKIRIQMDDLKNSHDKKINQLKESLKSQRQEWNKERQDINRKLKEAEDQLRILNIDYQNLMSKESAHENEKTTLQMEKDALITHIQDVEIRTLANKYKLDRISDHMIDVEAKLNNNNNNNNNSDKLTTDHLDQRDVESAQQLIRTICLQLKNIRDDMAKVKELGKPVPNLELLTTHSTNKDRIKYDDALLLVDFQPNQTNNGDKNAANTAAGERLISDPAVAKNSTKSAFCRTASSDSNYNFSTLHRLRSPSPSPRKITNYPEAPPSIIINTKKAIEYDKDGRRHWVRRSMCRSVSLDPTPVSKNPLVLTSASDLPPPSGSTQHPRSNSAGSDMLFRVKPKAAVSITATDSEIRPENWTQSCSAAVKPQMQKSREKIANLFSNLGREKGGSRVREKRRIFEGSRTSSVESSETGQMIGSLGMQTCLVGASSDIENILHNKKSGERNLPPRQARSSSATRLLQRLRGRSTSRDTPRSAFTEAAAAPSSSSSSSQKADDAASDRVAAGCFHTHNMKKRKNKPKAAAAPAYCNISTSEEQSQTTSNDDCYNKVINNKDTTTISLGDTETTESRALSSVNRSRPRENNLNK
ncbi:Protein SOGA2 [Trichinella patagoniensis]|uniref:Protein SOGA2 n=1 Tax=Trichinella patagoniensis TaxID=990121 RepID=A0A0V1A1H6_9BILA|nr:Protein SOGA2 [Trichinella patagoniensis]